MGLSSNQARLLMLTSGISDTEYQEVMIAQRQQQNAQKSEAAAKVYSEAMNNYKLEIKVVDQNSDSNHVSKELSYESMSAMGYIATTAQNQVMLKKDPTTNKWIIPKDVDGKDLLSIDETTGKAIIGTEQYEIFDGTEYLAHPKVLQVAVMNGTAFLYDTNAEPKEDAPQPLQSKIECEYVLDTSDDAAAQSQYEYETSKLAKQDNRLELDLKQIETQHEALLKEYDSVKEVINNTVERTYNLFSNG